VVLILALAGQALAQGSITGTVKFPDDEFREGSLVAITSANYDVFRTNVADDGTYAIDDAVPGTYTVAVIAPGLTAPDIKDVVVKEGETVTQDITLTVMEPVCIVKSPARIPLEDDINSASFADAPDILLNSGKHVSNGDLADWTRLGGPNAVSGRFRLKYSDYGFHLAGDLTFRTPLVNVETPVNAWRGNSLEFAFTDLPYDPDHFETAQGFPENFWKLQVGLGETAVWWEDNASKIDPPEQISANMLRKHKELKDDVGGELLRLDIPWSIFHSGDADGPPLKMPADNALAALNILIGASDPEADRETATRKWQLSWSGLPNSHWVPNQLMPVKFCPQPPAAGQ
jgi:hypothetical protein